MQKTAGKSTKIVISFLFLSNLLVCFEELSLKYEKANSNSYFSKASEYLRRL